MKNKNPRLGTKIEPIKCILLLVAHNNAEISLKNHSKIQGAIYNLLSQINPSISYELHHSSKVKPWTFSYLQFSKLLPKSEKKGYVRIRKGQKAFININTIDPLIYELIKKYALSKESIHIGDLKLIIEKLKSKRGNLENPPESLDTITIKLKTPTFFFNAKETKHERFTAETFLKYQCEKFKQLGILHLDPVQLFPFLRIIQYYTHKAIGYISSFSNKDELIRYKGIVGNLTFKIVGTPFQRSLMWKLIYLSEYTGIGVRTSLGFGHNTIISPK